MSCVAYRLVTILLPLRFRPCLRALRIFRYRDNAVCLAVQLDLACLTSRLLAMRVSGRALAPGVTLSAAQLPELTVNRLLHCFDRIVHRSERSTAI